MQSIMLQYFNCSSLPVSLRDILLVELFSAVTWDGSFFYYCSLSAEIILADNETIVKKPNTSTKRLSVALSNVD